MQPGIVAVVGVRIITQARIELVRMTLPSSQVTFQKIPVVCAGRGSLRNVSAWAHGVPQGCDHSASELIRGLVVLRVLVR